MSTLDPPAAAARRQLALDRIAEDLTGWGYRPTTEADQAFLRDLVAF